ncbi:MAG: helix-turn-helix domain-containing protein [Sphaerochaeta sp.]|nr:helix-turn-helix domain-containing protein [Sphaerochaeta sp.]
MEIQENQVLTLQECSKYLKIAESTIYMLARKGKLPCQKVGRNWRFSKDALDRWLRGELILHGEKKQGDQRQ